MRRRVLWKKYLRNCQERNNRKIHWIMRVIYKIARLELANLFFSPVAWFVLVFWVFIMGLNFTGKMEEMARMQEFGSSFYAITEKLFYGSGGLCGFLKTVLYFVMPVLTMGLISQEYNFGSIKLLFSSPITSRANCIWEVFGNNGLWATDYGVYVPVCSG